MRFSADHLALLERGKHPFVKVAWASLISFLFYHRRLTLPDIPSPLKEELSERTDGFSVKKACFVSLKKDGDLRGCIGTVTPTKSCLVEEIIDNAVSSAISDPRFPPLSPEELNDLSISVDILEEPFKAKLEDIDPARYGIIVEQGARKGLLLPRLAGVDTAEVQLKIASAKGGIDLSKPFNILLFESTRYE